MTKNCKAAMAAGVAGGYVLGRTKKAKLAFAVATYLVGRRFSLSPTHLITEGVERLRQTPQFQDLRDQFRGQIMTVGRDAVTAEAGRRVAHMTGRLRERTEHLRSGPVQGEGKPSDEPGKPAEAAGGAARKPADAAGGAARKTAETAGGAAQRSAGGTRTAARTTSRSAGAAARRTAAGAGSAARKATTAQRTAAKKKAATRTSGGEGRSPRSGAGR